MNMRPPVARFETGLRHGTIGLDVDAEIGFQSAYWQRLIDQLADSYFKDLSMESRRFGNLRGGIDAMRNEATILTHPLWDIEPDERVNSASH